MNAVSSLRIPTAFVVALLITGGLFSTLNELTSRSYPIPAVRPAPIDILKPREPTRPEIKRVVEKPIRELPTQEIDRPRIGIDRADIDAPVLIRPEPTIATIPSDRPNFGRDTDAVPLVRVPPEYPQREAAQGIEGWVKLRFTINEIGAVEDAVIVESSARGFEAPALKAIVRWRYNPKVENGQAVERRGIEVMLRFTLNE
jgi:periplasmic protein TonB